MRERAEVGDAQGVGGDRAGARATTRADADAVLLGPVDEVGHHQVVAAVALGLDDVELHLDPRTDGVGERVTGVARLDAAPDLLDEPALLVVARRDVGLGHVATVGLGELHVAALGDQERVVARLLHAVGVLPQRAHLLGRLDVVATAVEREPLAALGVGGLGESAARVDAEQRLLGVGVLGVVVVRVVGGDRRDAEILAEAQEVVAHDLLDREAVVHQLEEEVLLAEDVLELRGCGAGLVVLAQAQPGLDLAGRASGGGDDALAVAVEELTVGPGLEVVALKARQRRHAKEVVHALGAGGQHRHVRVGATAGDVVAALLLGVALAPADPTSLGAVGPGREVGLEPDDRLDAVLACLGPEVVRAVQVAVVGHRDGGHPEARGALEQAVQQGRSVEHRVLGVDVQVHEGRVARHRVDGLLRAVPGRRSRQSRSRSRRRSRGGCQPSRAHRRVGGATPSTRRSPTPFPLRRDPVRRTPPRWPTPAQHDVPRRPRARPAAPRPGR